MTATPIVIDLSHHNPEPDWAKLYAAGVAGVILKATENTGYVDPTFAERRDAAEAVGIKTASYHFLRPGNIAKQISHYLATVKPVTGERVVLDHEDAGVSLEDLALAFQTIVDQRPDLQLTLYSGHLIKDQLGGHNTGPAILKQTSLWIAQYTSADAPSWPKGVWPTWSLWQYTDKASVSGISAPVDGNRWNGSTENLLKWFGPASEDEHDGGVSPPEPEEDLPVELSVTIPKGVRLTVIVNGVQL